MLVYVVDMLCYEGFMHAHNLCPLMLCYSVHMSCCVLPQVYRHSFRPLIYSFSKEVESTMAVKMAMDTIQNVAMKFFGAFIFPSVSVSDHCDGLREGMAYIMKPPGRVSEECVTTKLCHFSDWAHIAVKYRKGTMIRKSNPYYDEIWLQLKAVHFAHSAEMKELLESLIFVVWDDWESYGEVCLFMLHYELPMLHICCVVP
jgi:hypothetical protein